MPTRLIAAERPRTTALVRRYALVAMLLLLAACSGQDDPQATRELSITGPDDGAVIGADDLDDLEVAATASWTEPGPDPEDPEPLGDLRLLVNGDDRTGDAEVGDDRLLWRGGDLADGQHMISLVRVPVPEPSEDGDAGASNDLTADDAGSEELATWQVSIDTDPPDITLSEPSGAVIAGEELQVVGETEPGATVRIGDDEVTADDAGSFELVLPSAPEDGLDLVATDRAGNASDTEMALVTVPSRAEVDEVRSVHVSFCGWAAPSLREPVMDLVASGQINAIQLDLKDESGKIGYDTQVPLAARIGADEPDCSFDLEAVVEQLHGMGVPVIGRIVAFADPVLATWAFANGEQDMAIQYEDGTLYTGRYAGFANFAHPDVVDYNLDIAEEAAAMGVDHILWDYIRKPDGTSARFPGLGDTDPRDAIVEFTRRASERVAPYGVVHGASVYGISADRPDDVAQDIPRMAEHLDYVAPMTYPSHWGPGEYGVANPLMEPYGILDASLEVWQETVAGKRARVVPWLEDSNYPIRLGYPTREGYLREQIRATYDAGIREWVLWDPAVRYTGSALSDPEPAG